MTDHPSLNSLLQWSITNSAEQNANDNDEQQQPRDATRGLNAAALAELLGGPSDADIMKESMSIILSSEADEENKLIAWDNLELLVEQIDNANNMLNLGLWPPLLSQLAHKDEAMRRQAAACVRTVVQNNVKSQETLLAQGGLPTLARLACEDPSADVRKKAVSAISSEVRNFQPALDELLDCLPKALSGQQRGLDAGDMAAVDDLVQKLREIAVATA